MDWNYVDLVAEQEAIEELVGLGVPEGEAEELVEKVSLRAGEPRTADELVGDVLDLLGVD